MKSDSHCIIYLLVLARLRGKFTPFLGIFKSLKIPLNKKSEGGKFRNRCAKLPRDEIVFSCRDPRVLKDSLQRLKLYEM